MVGERGILKSDGPSILFVAADGIGRCSTLVPMAINVARESKVWGRQQMSTDKDGFRSDNLLMMVLVLRKRWDRPGWNQKCCEWG